jgi:outer membrane protein assembly factor BamB
MTFQQDGHGGARSSIDVRRGRLRRKAALLLTLVVAMGGVLVVAPPAGAVSSTDWPAFLADPAHSSTNADPTFTTGNAAAPAPAWTFTPSSPLVGQPTGGFDASPVVADGRVFVGGVNGTFYALDESTGAIAWQKVLGWVPAIECSATLGITATATVGTNPSTGVPTVYVASGNGKLYALNVSNGKVQWVKTVKKSSTTTNDYYQWSSPTVANGKVYIGIASNCDDPLVRGGVRAYDQATGARLATWWGVPAGQTGATVWSSVAATPDAVYVTTGNGPTDAVQYSEDSIVKLDPTTLRRLGTWTVPQTDVVGDSDFGASPTLFTDGATPMVGACNKDGLFYALDADTMQLVWEQRISARTPKSQGIPNCVSSGVWDGAHLFVASAKTAIDGVGYRGAIRELDPTDGAVVWETGFGAKVLGNPTLNGAGVLAVPTWDSAANMPGFALVDASTGAQLTYVDQGSVFAQPTFAGGYLFVADEGSSLMAYVPG